MGLPAYIGTDLVRTALGFIGGNLNDASTYPAENVGNGILAKSTFFTYLGGNVEVHLPSTGFDTVFVGNHSLTATGTWDVRVGDISLVYTGNFASLPVWRSGDMWTAGDSGTDSTHRFVTVDLTQIDGTVTPIECGEIVVGMRTALPDKFLWEPYENQQVNTGITERTQGGVKWSYELSSYLRLKYRFQFVDSHYAAFKAFSDAVGADPFVFIPDVELPEVYYGTKDRGFYPQCIGVARDGSSLSRLWIWDLIIETSSEGITTL